MRVVQEILGRANDVETFYKGLYRRYCVECGVYYTSGDLEGWVFRCPLHLSPPNY